MFSTIQSPSLSLTWITLSLLPSPISTNGSSSAPMWIAVGAVCVRAMPAAWLPRARGDHAELARLIVGERLGDLFFGVHDERPVRHDRLADRLTAEEQHVDRRVAFGRAVQHERVTVAEHGELAGLERAA